MLVFFAAGSGILPAIVGVSMVSASTGALRGLWDDYKRKHKQASYEDIAQKWNETPEADSKSTALQKASAYNNFFDTVQKSMSRSEDVDMRDISWMHKLSTKIDRAIDASLARQQNVDALHYLKEQTVGVLSPKIEGIAASTFDRALNWRIDNTLDSMTAGVNRMNDAAQANAIFVAMQPVGDSAAQTLYNSRQMHLQNKLGVIREIIEKGLLLGGKDATNVQPELKHISDSVNALGPQLPLVKVAVENEARPHEKLRDTTYYENKYSTEKTLNSALYSAWNDSFERGAASLDPERILEKLSDFHEKLLQRSNRQDAKVDTAVMLLAEKFHDRIEQVQTLPGTNKSTTQALQGLQQKARDFIMEHAPSAVVGAFVLSEMALPVGNNYDRALGQGKAIEDFARVQIMTVKFAPEFQLGIPIFTSANTPEKFKSIWSLHSFLAQTKTWSSGCKSRNRWPQ